MRHDKYGYNNTEEVVYYLKKYRRVKEDWQADFYDAYGRFVVIFCGVMYWYSILGFMAFNFVCISKLLV